MLSPKQQRFIAEYLIDLNATQAAIRAGYSKKTANVQGSRLLTNAGIKAAVLEGTARHLNQNALTATRVLEEIRRLAFSDVRDLFDEQGNLRPLHTLTAEQAASIAGLEVIIKNAEAGDGKTDKVHKLKIWDKPKMLDLLAKHFQLLTEEVHHTGTLNLTWQS